MVDPCMAVCYKGQRNSRVHSNKRCINIPNISGELKWAMLSMFSMTFISQDMLASTDDSILKNNGPVLVDIILSVR